MEMDLVDGNPMRDALRLGNQTINRQYIRTYRFRYWKLRYEMFHFRKPTVMVRMYMQVIMLAEISRSMRVVVGMDMVMGVLMVVGMFITMCVVMRMFMGMGVVVGIMTMSVRKFGNIGTLFFLSMHFYADMRSKYAALGYAFPRYGDTRDPKVFESI